jgi:hypothetical protein
VVSAAERTEHCFDYTPPLSVQYVRLPVTTSVNCRRHAKDVYNSDWTGKLCAKNLARRDPSAVLCAAVAPSKCMVILTDTLERLISAG